jgi:hypothetical protein
MGWKYKNIFVLSPYGKFIGILRCENGDIISNASALCVELASSQSPSLHLLPQR